MATETKTASDIKTVDSRVLRTTASEALAILRAVAAEPPTWEAASDSSWGAANGKEITRRVWRCTVYGAKFWVVATITDSRWAGEGHKETWEITKDEPGDSLGGWGGGNGKTRTGKPIHVEAEGRFFDKISALVAEIGEVDSLASLLATIVRIHNTAVDMTMPREAREARDADRQGS